MTWGDFWTQGETYGSPTGDWYDTPLAHQGAQQNGEFLRFLTQRGYTSPTRKSQFAESLFPELLRGYNAASATNPLLEFRDYLSGFDQNFVENKWNLLTPEQQGKDYNRFANQVRINRRG